jgi:hypothetical protein
MPACSAEYRPGPAAAPPVLGRVAPSQPGLGLRLAGVNLWVLEQRGQEEVAMSLKIYPVILDLVRRLQPVLRGAAGSQLSAR